jgi:hypothetical protein
MIPSPESKKSERSSPTGLEIFVIEGQTPNVVIKIDGMLQSCFGLLHVWPATLA